jgi:nitrogen-specific signal transduction histidine kinase
VIFEAEDDGRGLSSPDAPIFDAFVSTKPDGTGLGLAITHRVVTDHSGEITVESRPGHTVFRVLLPLEPE